MRIRVTTRAHLYEERKRQHLERGYHIEDERPIPVNGFCSFIAVRAPPVSDTLSDSGAEALNGNHHARGDWRGAQMSLKIRFRFDGGCIRHPRYDPKRHGRPPDGKCEGCESLYVIHVYTKIATRRAEDTSLMVVRGSTAREEQQAIRIAHKL